MERAADDAIKSMGVKLFGDDVHFWNPDEDATVGTEK
jgi:hypothetical protein